MSNDQTMSNDHRFINHRPIMNQLIFFEGEGVGEDGHGATEGAPLRVGLRAAKGWKIQMTIMSLILRKRYRAPLPCMIFEDVKNVNGYFKWHGPVSFIKSNPKSN